MRLSETPTQIKMERNSTAKRTCRWGATLCISEATVGSVLKVDNGNTGVNISQVTGAIPRPVTCGELTGAVGAGASNGSAQQQVASTGAQHFIWQTGFAAPCVTTGTGSACTTSAKMRAMTRRRCMMNKAAGLIPT